MHGGCGRLAGRTDSGPLLYHKALPCCFSTASLPFGSKDVAFGSAPSLAVISGNPQVGLCSWKWTVGAAAGNDVWARSNGGGKRWQDFRTSVARRDFRVELAPEKAVSGRSSSVAVCFYKIVHLPGYEQLQQPLRDFCEASGVTGDIVLGANGINGTICGTQETVDDVLALVQSYPKLAGIWRFQLPLVPDLELIDHGQSFKFQPGVEDDAGFYPLQSFCRSLSHVLGSGKWGEQDKSSRECTRKKPVLDLQLSLASLSARSRMGGDSVNVAGPLQQLEWIRVAANLLLARLLGSAVVFLVSCYRDRMRDLLSFWMRYENEANKFFKFRAASIGTPPVCEIPASVPWNPVALDSRFKWQRRNGKNISRPPRLKKVSGRTVSAASARDYKQAKTSDATDSAQATASNNSFQVIAKGSSGDSSKTRKKSKEMKVSQKGKTGSKSTQRGEGEPCRIGETLNSDRQIQMIESRHDTVGIEAGDNRAAVFQNLFVGNGPTPTQGSEVADPAMLTSKQVPEPNGGKSLLDKTPGRKGVLLNNNRQVANGMSRKIRKEDSRPPNESQPQATGGNRVVSISSISEGEALSGGTTLDWISQMVDQREKWILESKTTAKTGPKAVSKEPVLVNDGSSKPLEEIASSVAARLRMLQTRLVATKSALQSGRVALTQKDGYLNEIHSRTSAELVRASDALEFREDELLRTIAVLRKTHANAKAKALFMDVMEEHNEAVKVNEDNEAVNPGAPLLKRTARVVWPNSAREVAIAGSFNGWTRKVPMRKSNAGVFVASLELYPGRYEIKFVVDGSWRVDPRRPIVYDQGYENNVLIIS